MTDEELEKLVDEQISLYIIIDMYEHGDVCKVSEEEYQETLTKMKNIRERFAKLNEDENKE